MNAPQTPTDYATPGVGPAQAPPSTTDRHARAWVDPPHGVDPRRKSPLLACILSAMPGLGQIYVGYYKMGFIHMAVWGSALAMAIASSDLFPTLLPPLVIFVAFFYLYNVIDAGRRASFYNQALAGLHGVELPEEMSLPSPGGSIGGGVALIIFGAIMLSHTVFDFSLAWLEDWWPAAPVLVGVWLVARGIQERQKTE